MHERISLQSIETRSSWVVASVVLVILAISFGAPWITVVALKPIAAETEGLRSVPALAASLAWIGLGAGGIGMGAIAAASKLSVSASLTLRAVTASVESRATAVAASGEAADIARTARFIAKAPRLAYVTMASDSHGHQQGIHRPSTISSTRAWAAFEGVVLQPVHRVEARFTQSCPQFCEVAARPQTG